MVKKMRPHCETMVREIFPQIRSLIAKELTENLGFTQEEAALKMGISQPAISQYKKEFRASKTDILENNPRIMLIIKTAAKNLVKSKNPQHSGILCSICKQMRDAGILSEFREELPST